MSTWAGVARAPVDALAMVAASAPVAGLPRAEAFTDALLAGIAPTRTCGAATLAVALTGARRRLDEGLAGVVAGTDPGPPPPLAPVPPLTPLLRIGHYQVTQALVGHLSPARHAAGTSPFRWTARGARRSIGLASLRAGLDGRAATPSDAVAGVMAEPGGPFGVGRTGPGSCADWIASLAPPARALVEAEATAWTTRLWTAVDWGRFAPYRLVVGGPDRWWRWNGRVGLRGRADVRIGVEPGGDDGPLGAHLAVLDGQPGPASRHALLLSALVDAMSSRRPEQPAPVPACVAGWWPDCGRSWIVPVDARTLVAAADAVVSTARALLGNGTPGGLAAHR